MRTSDQGLLRETSAEVLERSAVGLVGGPSDWEMSALRLNAQVRRPLHTELVLRTTIARIVARALEDVSGLVAWSACERLRTNET